MANKPQKFAPADRIMDPVHRIVQRSAIYQSLFFYVQGVQAVNPEIPIGTAVQSYCDRFLPNKDNPETMIEIYRRLLREYLSNSKIFEE
jgi:hypothetical protein